MLLQDEQGKDSTKGSGPEAVLQGGRQGVNQTGGNSVEPCLGQHQSNPSGISSEIGFQTGSRIGSEPVSLSIPARMESVSVDPLTPRP